MRNQTGAIDTAILDNLRQLDRQAEGFLEEAITLFLQKAQRDLEALRRADTDGQATEAMRDRAHSLKGSASSIGALHLASVCGRLAVREGRDATDCESLLDEVEEAYERAAAELRPFLPGRGSS